MPRNVLRCLHILKRLSSRLLKLIQLQFGSFVMRALWWFLTTNLLKDSFVANIEPIKYALNLIKYFHKFFFVLQSLIWKKTINVLKNFSLRFSNLKWALKYALKFNYSKKFVIKTHQSIRTSAQLYSKTCQSVFFLRSW